MKIPIILQSTRRKTKKQLVKEFMGDWNRFLGAKKKIGQNNAKPLMQ